jgi:hypothetical protein
VAFFNRRDAHYIEAREHMTDLLRSGTPLATSTWTTYEAITITRSKLGRTAKSRNVVRVIALVTRCALPCPAWPTLMNLH